MQRKRKIINDGSVILYPAGAEGASVSAHGHAVCSKFFPARILLLLCLVVAALVFSPKPANAFVFVNPMVIGAGGDVCPLVDLAGNQLMDAFGNPIPEDRMLTRRIIPCIKYTILFAASQLLAGISFFMAKTIAACMTLAIIFWGMMIMSGRLASAWRDTMILALKMGAVLMFTNNFAAAYFDPTGTKGGLFGMLLDSIDWLATIVVAYVMNDNLFTNNADCLLPTVDFTFVGGNIQYNANAIWDMVDCMLDIMIGGIMDPSTIFNGLIAFFIVCMITNAVGFAIGSMGLYLITEIISAILRTVYIVLSCYLAFSFMILVSPFFIPLILFRATKSYFGKWVQLTGSYMLQPMVVFAYIGMLVLAFDTVVYSGPNSLFRAIAGPAVGFR